MRRASKTEWRVYAAIGLLIVATLLSAFNVSDPAAEPLVAGISAESYTATLHVNVTDDVGRPVPEATVNIIGNDTKWYTDEFGVVLINGLLADSEGTDYTTYAECTGYVSSAPATVTLTPENTTYANLTVRGGGIFGTVSADGVSIADANITLLDAGQNEILNTTTSIDGSYILEGIRGGTYSVVANATHHAAQTKVAIVTEGNYIPLHFSLESLTGGISGTILHMDTEEPLENASVAVTIGSYTIVYYSGVDGSYNVPNVPPGTYAITVSLTGFNTTVVEDIVVVSGVITDGIDVLLAEKLPSISGRVVHSDTEEPLEGANISITVEDYTITVKSNANGSYRLWDIPPGSYTITISLTGFNTTILEDVVVLSGVTTEIADVLLTEKETILSGVVKAGTVLLVGANVSLVGTSLYGLSSVDGEYEIRNIPVGTYTVVASLLGYDNATILNVQIDRGSEIRLNINLTGKLGGMLYGVVVDESTGNSLAGVRVTLLPQRETITNIYGEFQFTGLESGDYTLMFTLEGYRPIEMGDIYVGSENRTDLGIISLQPVRESFGGFIFGFDLAHSMMILALFLTIVILALAVVLRIRSFEAPDKAPAVYDDLEEDEESANGSPADEDDSAYEE